jgi:low temperature requirement protein LtrA
LVKGNALGVAGRLVLLIVMALVISTVLSMIFGDTSALARLVSFFVGILLQVFMVSYLYAIYTNLRDSKPRPEGYEPTGLSKALTYGAFGLGVALLLLAVPVLFLVNPKAQMDRARDAQMRKLQMQQELPDMESLQEQMPFPELNQ